jgi:hypothetical protein
MVLPSCRAGEQIPDDIRRFGKRYQTVHHTGDSGMIDMLSLFHWEHTTIQLKEAVTRSLYFDLDTAIASITFRPWLSERDTRDFFPKTPPLI